MDKQLLDEIIRRVLQELEVTSQKSILSIMEPETTENHREYTLTYGDQYDIQFIDMISNSTITDVLLLPTLTIGELGRLAHGISISPKEEILLEMLYHGKTIWIKESNYCPESPMFSLLQENKGKLEKMGMVFLTNIPKKPPTDLTNKNLLTEKDFLNIPSESIVKIREKAIVTPSAQDMIRNKQIEVLPVLC